MITLSGQFPAIRCLQARRRTDSLSIGHRVSVGRYDAAMPTTLRLDDHVAAIGTAADVLLDAAERAGLETKVPTCPAWDVRQLVTHLGMVHRWAAASLRGDTGHRTDDSVAAAAAAPHLLTWFREGTDALRAAIAEAPDDVEAMVFLRDAPPPRRFWARRQAHETTIHGVDAIGAALGRTPTAAELDIDRDIAIDGIDELLCGFITRGKGKLRSEEPYTIAVAPAGGERAWTVAVSDGSVVTTPGDPESPDATFTGTAVQLYTGLWNRGDEIVSTGRPDALDMWHRQVKVRWS